MKFLEKVRELKKTIKTNVEDLARLSNLYDLLQKSLQQTKEMTVTQYKELNKEREETNKYKEQCKIMKEKVQEHEQTIEKLTFKNNQYSNLLSVSEKEIEKLKEQINNNSGYNSGNSGSSNNSNSGTIPTISIPMEDSKENSDENTTIGSESVPSTGRSSTVTINEDYNTVNSISRVRALCINIALLKNIIVTIQ